MLYLASVELVTVFQPGGESPAARVRQQGQALLSGMWALVGVAALVAGLVRDRRELRIGALALLAVTLGEGRPLRPLVARLDVPRRVVRRPRHAAAGRRVRVAAAAAGAGDSAILRPAGAYPVEVTPDHDPDLRRAESLDEELLEAETVDVETYLTDARRIERIDEELRTGFAVARARRQGGLGLRLRPHAAAATPSTSTRARRARKLGEAGFAIITGGGPGVMEAANRGAKEAGVASIGLDIELPHEQFQNRWVDLPLTFHYFFTRKVMFVRYASAFVVFPGGFGTLDELFEAATLRQTGKIRHFPIVLVGRDYWQGLVDWLAGPVLAGGKIAAQDVERLQVTDDLDEVFAIVESAEHRRPRAA